jgi:hypothetical protein
MRVLAMETPYKMVSVSPMGGEKGEFWTPPPELAELPTNVLFVIVTVPVGSAAHFMAPPRRGALLPEKVLFVIVLTVP